MMKQYNELHLLLTKINCSVILCEGYSDKDLNLCYKLIKDFQNKYPNHKYYKIKNKDYNNLKQWCNTSRLIMSYLGKNIKRF